MPSAEPGGPERLGWLRSQGLGLICGFGTVLLLAAGSVILSATRDGASASVGLDDLRGFFAPPSWTHGWLYLLGALAALYALNTLLATWETVTRRWRAGVRAPAAYAASVIHVGFLVALSGHVLGGFTSEDFEPVVVTERWSEVPGLGAARLLTLEIDAMPGGMPRSARATLAVRGPDGEVRQEIVDYNQPLSRGLGSRLALLAEFGRVNVPGLGPRPAILLRPRTAPANPWALASAVLVAGGLVMMWRRLVPSSRRESASTEGLPASARSDGAA